MTNGLFSDLPETFPERDQYKHPALGGSVVIHVVTVVLLLLVPFAATERLSRTELLTMLVSPIPPPPAPPPPLPAGVVRAKPPAVANEKRVELPTLIAPTAIPAEIARVVDEPVAGPVGVVGGVPGGIPGGRVGGVLGGILDRNVIEPPPPPPAVAAAPELPVAPLPREPVRVGGNVKEPRITRLVPPVYPVLASKARVHGSVVLEAVLREDGRVDEIRVISGHPLLLEAAIECVKQWEYEPTYLNGTPVRVRLTAVVNFNRRPVS